MGAPWAAGYYFQVGHCQCHMELGTTQQACWLCRWSAMSLPAAFCLMAGASSPKVLACCCASMCETDLHRFHHHPSFGEVQVGWEGRFWCPPSVPRAMLPVLEEFAVLEVGECCGHARRAGGGGCPEEYTLQAARGTSSGCGRRIEVRCCSVHGDVGKGNRHGD